MKTLSTRDRAFPPTEAELICARAFAEAEGLVFENTDSLYQDFVLDRVRRIIRALYNPTPDMLMATRTKSLEDAIRQYRYMINAASPVERAADNQKSDRDDDIAPVEAPINQTEVAHASNGPLHIREWRKFRGLSQQALSRKCGAPQTTISRWEKGCASPTLTKLRTLASALRCDPWDLLHPPGNQPTLALVLVERRTMPHLDNKVREVWVDEADQIWWRIFNDQHPSGGPYIKGDPRG